MHHLVTDYCCFFKYIHGFTRKILKKPLFCSMTSPVLAADRF